MSDLPFPHPDSDQPAPNGEPDQMDVGHGKKGPDGSLDKTSSPENIESASQSRLLFDEVAGGLRAFLRHRLRQESDVDDCLQVVFVRMMESIQDVAPAARRAWLFRVAANESARIWRREAAGHRVLEQQIPEQVDNDDPVDKVILTETISKVEQSLSGLPTAWQEIVRLRIHQNLTFQQIADQLDIPLGTALTRMRRALERLKTEIDQDTT